MYGPDDLYDQLDAAKSDRIQCRDPQTIPDEDNATVLVATGDSVTSAHQQTQSSDKTCGFTSSDARGLPGNNANFSYVGRYYQANQDVVEYYNFARTGFGVSDIVNAGPNSVDACGKPWLRNFSPLALAAAEVQKAKAAGHQAYFVTTGGINDTNWTTVVQQLLYCQGLDVLGQITHTTPGSKFHYSPNENTVITTGGGCTLEITNPNPLQPHWFLYGEIKKFNGPEMYNAIAANAGQIVNTMLNAGADKVIWMMYYDITPANVDVGTVAEQTLRPVMPPWLSPLVPRLGPKYVPLIGAQWTGPVRQINSDLNTALLFAMPLSDKVQIMGPPNMATADLQDTAIGGSPHPDAAGHIKLEQVLANGFDSIG